MIDNFDLDNIRKHFDYLHKNIFFDSEFSRLFRLFKDFKDVIESIQKRIERKEEPLISSSKFQYLDMCRNKMKFPHLVYDFHCLGDFCRIERRRDVFFVFCNWLSVDDTMNFRRIPSLFGEFLTLDEAEKFYRKIVREYLEKRDNVLF